VLAAELSDAALRSWILPLRVIAGSTADDGYEIAEGQITLSCPTNFHREQIARRYQALIEAAVDQRVTLVVNPVRPNAS